MVGLVPHVGLQVGEPIPHPYTRVKVVSVVYTVLVEICSVALCIPGLHPRDVQIQSSSLGFTVSMKLPTSTAKVVE